MGSYASGALELMGSFSFSTTLIGILSKMISWPLVKDFELGKLDIHRLNFAIVTLILKVSDVNEMKDCRTISLSNCYVNYFNKAITNRIFLPLD